MEDFGQLSVQANHLFRPASVDLQIDIPSAAIRDSSSFCYAILLSKLSDLRLGLQVFSDDMSTGVESAGNATNWVNAQALPHYRNEPEWRSAKKG
jgi:hypothetical protein